MSLLNQGSPTSNIWPYVWKLLRLRAIIFINGFRRARMRRKIGLIFLSLLGLGFLAFVFFLSYLLLGFLRSPQLAEIVGDVNPILQSVPVFIVGGAFLGILLTSFGVLLQALYLAGDMDFLLSAPVPIRAVFIAKLLQAILPNFSLICLFALPILYGLGAAGHYNLLYYPLVLIVLASLALAAAGLSSLLVMFIVRIFPARRVAEVLGFIGAIASMLCSQSGQLANFGNLSRNQVGQAAQLAARFDNPWSPLAWAGRGLVDLGQGRGLSGGGFLLLSIGLSIVVFTLALTTAERLYYTGWASLQGNRRRKKTARAARAATQRPLAGIAGKRIPSPVRAIIAKDYSVLRRDVRNMSQLVTPLIFGIVYAVTFFRGGGPPVPEGNVPAWLTEALHNLPLYGSVAISLFVGWMLLWRLAGMGFSQEGKSFWMLKTAPISPTQMLEAKYLVAFLPTLALGWVFLLAISLIQHTDLSVLLYTLPVVALCIAGNTGVNLSFGVTGANLAWEDPRHMLRSSTSCLGSLATMIYLPLCLLLFFSPPLLFALLDLPQLAGQLLGLALGGVFSLVCAILPLWLVRNRLARLGE